LDHPFFDQTKSFFAGSGFGVDVLPLFNENIEEIIYEFVAWNK